MVKIGGLNKLTLIDYPTKIATTVFLCGCNFNCHYCHNRSLIETNEEVMSEEAFFGFLEKRKGILEGVCITGGEPLFSLGIEDFIKKIKEKGYLVKLDTNGSLPEKLKTLLKKGYLDYVAMDIKGFSQVYTDVIGIKNFPVSLVKQSLEVLKNSGVDYELRTTFIKPLHTKENVEMMAKEIGGEHPYFLQNYRQVGVMENLDYESFSKEEMESFLKIIKIYLPNARLREI